MYADVLIIDGPGNFDQVLTYSISADNMKAEAGSLVSVNVRQKIMKGIVLAVHENRPDLNKIKDINQLLTREPIISENGLKLAKWIADYYVCSLNKVIQLYLPPPVRLKEKTVYLPGPQLFSSTLLLPEKDRKILEILNEHEGTGLSCQEINRKMGQAVQNELKYLLENKYIQVSTIFVSQVTKKEIVIVEFIGDYEEIGQAVKRARRQAAILEIIKDRPCSVDELKELGVYNKPALKALYERGVIKINREKTDRDPVKNGLKKTRPNALNSYQEKACGAIYHSIKEGGGKWLLYGVTGSGKTEVFLRAIEEALHQGKQVLYLVPEISLTPQVIALLINTFGKEVAVLHSALSPGERYDEWMKIKENRAKVVLGPRSAVFAPFSNLGLIIIDEEHENTYKQNEPEPRYDARCVAEKLAELWHAALISGSATPSLKSFYRADLGKYGLLRMPYRVSSRPMPTIEIVDMKKEIKGGNTSIFSDKLVLELHRTIEAGEQAILFMNRRGFHTFVMCRECGKPLTCPHCSITLTYHHADGILACHYCNYQQPISRNCPFCGSTYVRYYGTGTERVEEELIGLFPQVPFVRMDTDTTQKKDSHTQILKDFQDGKAKVLIGTQMVAKGLDFPNVTLVGIINPDFLLNMPDYQSGERAYQLISQVGGRAGRGSEPGKVIIQTYDPDHYLFSSVIEQNYEEFYGKEISNRKILEYPPFYHLTRILVSGYNERQVIRTIELWTELLNKTINDMELNVEILGPVPAPLGLIKKRFRYHIIMKGVDLEALQNLARVIREKATEYSAEPRTIIDIEPQSLL